MQPLGEKLRQARLAKQITLEEASRVTKIRPSRIQEIEEEDFSSFASLAYAKGFLLIYGKFLEVDVSPYLDAFETSDRMTVDGYSYLQDKGPAAPPPIVRRQSTKGPSFLPFLLAIGVAVIGIYLVKLFLQIERITPGHGAETVAVASPSAAASPNASAAPRALPVEGRAPSEAGVAPLETPTTTPAETSTPAPSPSIEIRRAVPVNPQDLAPNPRPSPNEKRNSINLVTIRPKRRTYVSVVLDHNIEHPVFKGWLEPSDRPLTYEAEALSVKALESEAIEVTKNGAPVAAGDQDVTIE